MKYLPIENITYRTKLDTDEVIKIINEITQLKNASYKVIGNFEKIGGKPYEGSIDENSFHLTRIIGYRNSFLPRIHGVVEKDSIGSKIKVKMRMHKFISFFILFWFGGVVIGCLVGLTLQMKSESFEPMSLIPFGMLVFGYALVIGGFKHESLKSKKYFEDLFEAKIQ